MRIEHDLKLTFDDVLIRPKRSTLVSRSDVTLVREFTFRHSNKTWTGVPIVAANMDTTGVFGVAKVLQNHGMLTCLQKFYSTKECSNAWSDNVDPRFVAITCGSTENSLELLKKKMSTSNEISMICVDVANGYREVFLDYIKEVRMNFPNSIVIAGNVDSSCSYNMVSVYVGSSKYVLSAWYVCEIKSPTATVQAVKDMRYFTYFNVLSLEQPFGVAFVSSVGKFLSFDKFLPIVIKFDISNALISCFDSLDLICFNMLTNNM